MDPPLFFGHFQDANKNNFFSFSFSRLIITVGTFTLADPMAQDPENWGEWDLMREAGGFLNNKIV
jgi:hypothetical protein